MRASTGRSKMLAAMLTISGLVVMHLLWSETPHGQVSGTLVTAERGDMLAGVPVTLVPVDRKERARHAKTSDDGSFSFNNVPVGKYSLVTETHAHEQPKGKIKVEEGEVATAVFELEPTEPFLRVFQPQQVFGTDEQPMLRVHGFVTAEELSISLHRVDTDVAISRWSGWLPNGLSTHGRKLEDVELTAVKELEQVKSWELSVAARDLEGVFREQVSLGALEPGMYLVSVSADDLRRLNVVTVTDLGLVVKASRDEAIIFAADIRTGEALPGVSALVRHDGDTVTKGTTGPDGLLALDIEVEKADTYEVIGRHNGSLAVAEWYPYWHREQGPMRVYTYTDRPVYRPGHAVHFKSLLREIDGSDYSVPEPRSIRVRVVDERENVVHSEKYETNAYGSLNGSFELSDSALPGPYTLTLTVGAATYEYVFNVAEYRKPEFEATVTPARERYTRGEEIEAVVEAKYYFGAPVADAAVEYYVTRAGHWYHPHYDEWDADLYEAYDTDEGEVLARGDGRTDEHGRLAIAVPTRDEDAEDAEALDYDERFVIHVEIVDDSRRSVSQTGSTLVTQGDMRLEVSFDDWSVPPGDPVTATIRAIDYDGNPQPDIRGRIEFGVAQWTDGEEQIIEEDVAVWTTDDNGVATVSVTPTRGGDYRLVAMAKDDSKNVIRRSTSLWVMSSGGDSYSYPYQDLSVRADRDLYHEGDTAEVIVRTRHAPISALLTIESGGILEHRVVRLEDKATVISIDIAPEHMPSVNAAVSFVHEKKLLSGSAALNVSRESKALQVEIVPDQAAYEPGQAAQYRVRALSPSGEPVQAEVSLGLVDEAIYAIARERATNILQYFYPKRAIQVDTAFSFPEVYLAGDDKGPGSIRTRKDFRDTADWHPSTVTDANGEASFSITIPDNLTTWRATCRAVTLDTHVGQAVEKRVVNKPFMVRLVAPRFLVQGDSVQLAAVVHNETSGPVTAQVEMSGEGLGFESSAAASVAVPAGGSERVEWSASVAAVDSARIHVKAQAGQLGDAMELTLPCFPLGRERSVQSSWAVEGSAAIGYVPSANDIPGTQRMTVRLSPSVGGAMLGALPYLAKYPYGCVEQTMSSFLPDIAVMRVLEQLGAENPELQEELPKMVDSGLLRLYDMQNYDGGWGWWRHDSPDVWMTAYATYGLLEARDAGFDVNDRALRRGLSSLAEQVEQQKKLAMDTRAYAAAVLARGGRKDASLLVIAPLMADDGREQGFLSDWGRAMLARAVLYTRGPTEAREILSDAWTEYDAEGEFRVNRGRWRSQVEVASAVLSAACELTPDDERLAPLVQWIIKQRQANHWTSTRDTAFAVYALSEYALISDELAPDMDVTVRFGDDEIAVVHFGPEDIFRPEQVITIPVGAEAGECWVERSGTGNLYVTSTRERYVSSDMTRNGRSAPGLMVERSYRKVERGGDDDEAVAPSPHELTFESGDIIEVTLTVRADREFDHLLVEDMLPAGCEVLTRGRVETWEWDNWWVEEIARDERMAFAITRLVPGARRLRYRLAAQIPGEFTALPPKVFDMYNPEIRSEGKANVVRVTD